MTKAEMKKQNTFHAVKSGYWTGTVALLLLLTITVTAIQSV